MADADAGLRIGEVARRAGLTVRTLHHYDRLGLLVPNERTWGDHRLYSPADLRRLLEIQHLKSLGLGLAEIAAALDDPSFDARAALEGHIALLQERLAAERQLLVRLRGLRDAADAGWQEVLDVVALVQRLQHPEPTVRVRAALDADATPAPVLVEQLASDANASVREMLTWAIVRRGPEALPLLVARLDDADPVVRFQMAHALGKLDDARAVGPLVRALDDPDAGVRSEAAFALGRLGGPEALAALVARLGDPDELVRGTVTDALAGLGGAAVEPLTVAFGGLSTLGRRHAAEALGFLADERAAGVLAAGVADPDADVRLASLFALGRCPGGAADAAIAGALASDDARLRALASRLSEDRRPPRSGRSR